MTLFEAMGFFRQLGTTWYDQSLDPALRTVETFAHFQEAEKTIDEPSRYRLLSREEGREVALAAFELYKTRTMNDDYLVPKILSNLAKFASGALQGLYEEIIERELYWGDGITFREADLEVCIQLLGLLETDLESQSSGSLIRTDILAALAWNTNDIVLEAFQRWYQNPPPWASSLSQPPECYTYLAGWELTADGQKRYLYHPECYELIPRTEKMTSFASDPVSISAPAQEVCPSCGQQLTSLFVLNLLDPRLKFLSPKGDQVTIPLCPSCEGFEEDFPSVKQPLILGPVRNPYETIGLYWDSGLSRIGGHPEWVQYPDYPQCTHCQRTMMFIAQLCITDIDPGFEGISYAFRCSDCGTTATTYQST